MEQNGQKQWMWRYLLGQMSPEERASVEARYIGEDELFEELLEGENAMLDAYVRGDVSKEERTLIEQKYLTTAERRDRVAFAKALQQLREREMATASGTSPAPSRSSAFRWTLGLACACAIALLVAGWLAFENRRLRLDLQSARAEAARLAGRQQELERELRTAGIQPGQTAPDLRRDEGNLPPGVLALTLSPVGLRGGANRGNILKISSRTSAVQFTLPVSVRLRVYQVVIQTAEGIEVWRKDGLSMSQGAVVVVVPADRLREGDYIVQLRGVTGNPPPGAGDYSLHVF